MGWYADYKARGEARRKKRDCIHEWNDAGKVGYDGTRAMYCPICDKSTQVGETTSKIMLNEVMIRKLHDGKVKMTPCHIVLGGKNEPNCTYPIAWKRTDELELTELYGRLELSHSMYERMFALEKRKEKATGLPINREGSRARVEFMERQASEDNERMRRIVQHEVRTELNRMYTSVDKVPTNVR